VDRHTVHRPPVGRARRHPRDLVPRPAAFAFPPELTEVERAYAHREARLGFGGVLAALPDVLWVTHPNRAADAMYKPLQLATAAACGLHVVPTLVTNSPDAVRRFAGTLPGGVVHKSFGPNSITEGGQLKVAYTRRFTAADTDDLRGVGSTAVQAQAWVDKGSEARVVVIGERMFTILINATSAAAHVDWRADFDALTYELIDTPPEVETGVRAYMKALGLAYAALDFGIEKDTGRFVFYESNSSGQYGWLEAQTGAPITPHDRQPLAKLDHLCEPGRGNIRHYAGFRRSNDGQLLATRQARCAYI
jgi:hypothetical protein